MKSVESIFLEYESKTDPFSEAEISDRLRQLAEQQPKINEEFVFRAESLAFLFAKNAGINNYYGPYFKCKHDDGSVFENPSISDLTPEILEYWQDRCKHAQHPALRLRYSDLVWDLTKSVTGSGADVKFAQEAVDQTIALCSRAIPFKFPAVEGKKESLFIFQVKPPFILVFLTTMDWEALPFYQKLGYQIEYVREGYEKDSKMFVLRKTL